MQAGLALKQSALPESGTTETLFPSRYLKFGPFQLDVEQHQLFQDGQPVKVQGKVYQALVALLESPGKVVTREELRSHLWPADIQVNYDANVNTTVNKLRQVLSDTNDRPQFVETIPRRGYSFIAKVEYADHTDLGIVRSTENQEPQTLRQRLGAGILFGSRVGKVWFAAGIIALLAAAMLFGAALALYSRRAL